MGVEYWCSFCGKGGDEVELLIGGPEARGGSVYICNECIDHCNEIVDDEQRGRQEAARGAGRVAALRVRDHLALVTFTREEKDEALAALRESHPQESVMFEEYLLQGKSQEEIASQFGVTQSSVSKCLHRADEFITRHLLDLPESRPPRRTLAAVAKLLGISRKELVKKLAEDISPAEHAEALGRDPILFAAAFNFAMRCDSGQVEEALKLVSEDGF